MASHKGWDRSYPVKAVATSGGSFNLGKGTLALIDLEAAPTSNGLAVVSSLNGLPKDRKLQLRVGKFGIANSRSQSSKDWSTEQFRVTDIMKLEVDAPKGGIETDEVIIGYDGLNDDTAIVMGPGQNETIGINLSGEVIGALGYTDAEVELKLYLETPNIVDDTVTPTIGDYTMQEIVEKAVERWNRMTFMGGVPVTDYVEAVVTNSESVALTGTDSSFYNLIVDDQGDSNALAKVQSQFTDYKVIRSSRSGETSTYTIVDAAGETIDDYVKTKSQYVKGCDACASGYSELEGGFVYVVEAEDPDETAVTTVQTNFPNAVLTTATVIGRHNGSAIISVVASSEATQTELGTFETAADFPEGYSVEFVGEVESVCANPTEEEFSWEEGETCTAVTDTYTITLKDDKCGENKIDEINAAYATDGLTITVDAAGGCQTRYTTTVLTDLVCDECDPKFQALVTSEAPRDFEGKSWTKEEKAYSETALMGIKFKAKPIKLMGSETYRDDMPYFATSARIEIAGGYESNVNESFDAGRTGRFSVTVLNIASDPENWGGSLREFEDITRRFEEGVSRHEGNNYAKWILGEETMLDADVPYVDYILTLRLVSYAQSFSGEKAETYQLHFYVEPGKHTEVESLMNMLAGRAGVTPVQAYGKA